MSGRLSRLKLVYGKRFEHLTDRPHVVAMSGGRSSSGMTVALARSGELRPERGDAILFVNTAAEHPGTYVFTRQVSEELEGLGFPVFWLEWCTVERPAKRYGGKGYVRVPWWRIVNRDPWDADSNPEGYRTDGWVFEELMSWRGKTPSNKDRFCTREMKVATSAKFCDEWFNRGATTLGAGHFDGRKVSVEARVAKYFKKEGKRRMSRERAAGVFEMAYTSGDTGVRPQRWQDYTAADVSGWAAGKPGRVDLWYNRDMTYVKLLGLRGDEPRRVAGIMDRIIFNKDCEGDRAYMPPGENLLVPLHDGGITKPEVTAWWSGQPYDLDIPEWAGNCSFCFMKGPQGVMQGIAGEDHKKTIPDDGTPLDWWIRMEQRYGVDLSEERGEGAMFGFLGYKRPTYAEIRYEGGVQYSLLGDDDIGMPCECTD